MIRRAHILVAAASLLGTVVACNGDEVAAPTAPKAFIRFVHAMPDTLGVDFRAVDIVENTPYIATVFREMKQAGYVPVTAGTRHFREFLSNPSAPVASTVSKVLTDTVLTLVAGDHYTIIHAGFARVGQSPGATFVVMRDEHPVPPAGQMAIRIVNLAAGLGNVDVYASPSGTEPLPALPLIADAAWLTATDYVFIPVSVTLSFRATAAGAGSLASPFASVAAPSGDAGTPSLDPIPGSGIAGSVLTVYVFGRSTPGSFAPQFAAPALIVVPDVQLHDRPTP
jgi:hypothetical protein